MITWKLTSFDKAIDNDRRMSNASNMALGDGNLGSQDANGALNSQNAESQREDEVFGKAAESLGN